MSAPFCHASATWSTSHTAPTCALLAPWRHCSCSAWACCLSNTWRSEGCQSLPRLSKASCPKNRAANSAPRCVWCSCAASEQ
eukprot:7458944-Lingulodinium_polyedra.AAC.1